MQGTFAVNGTDIPEPVSGIRRGGLRVTPTLFGRSSSSHVAPLPPPWTVENIPGGFKVLDANQQSLAYVYSRETERDAQIAGVLTEDEARRIASNIAKLPTLLGATKESELDFQKEAVSRRRQPVWLTCPCTSDGICSSK